MKEATEGAVKALIKKSEKADDSNDALKFSQAALNTAHARSVLSGIKEA